MQRCRKACTGANPYPGMRASWPGNASWRIAGAGASGDRLYRISMLARTPPSGALPCSHATPPAIAATFRLSKSSLPQRQVVDLLLVVVTLVFPTVPGQFVQRKSVIFL